MQQQQDIILYFLVNYIKDIISNKWKQSNKGTKKADFQQALQHRKSAFQKSRIIM